MSELITIQHLNALLGIQARLLHAPPVQALPAFDPIFPERNEHRFEIDAETWSASIGRTARTFVHRRSGHSVRLAHDHPSAFAFSARGLYHFVASVDAADGLDELVVDNWLIDAYRRGRLAPIAEYQGYYTIG